MWLLNALSDRRSFIRYSFQQKRHRPLVPVKSTLSVPSSLSRFIFDLPSNHHTQTLFFTMLLENLADLHGALGVYGSASTHGGEIFAVFTVSRAARHITWAPSCECDRKVSDHTTDPAPETTGNQRQWQRDICQSRRLLAIDGRQKAVGSRRPA